MPKGLSICIWTPTSCHGSIKYEKNFLCRVIRTQLAAATPKKAKKQQQPKNPHAHKK